MTFFSLILGILVALLTLSTKIGGIINDIFPMFFYKSKIKIKKEYGNNIIKNETFIEEKEVIKTDLSHIDRSSYYGNVYPTTQKIIPLLVYYGGASSVDKAGHIARLLKLNNKFKKITMNMYKVIGQIILSILAGLVSIIFWSLCMTKIKELSPETSDFYLYVFLSTLSFCLYLFFIILLFLSITYTFMTICYLIKTKEITKRKIYLRVLEINNKKATN